MMMLNHIRIQVMAITYARGKRTSSAKVKVGVAALVGVAAALATAMFIKWQIAPLLGWDAAAVTYLVWEATVIWPMDGKVTAAHALLSCLLPALPVL
jgi:uncharacterized membrane protein